MLIKKKKDTLFGIELFQSSQKGEVVDTQRESLEAQRQLRRK